MSDNKRQFVYEQYFKEEKVLISLKEDLFKTRNTPGHKLKNADIDVDKKNDLDRQYQEMKKELLKDRGIHQPYEWLHPDESYEHSPWLFQQMVKAVDLLNLHIKHK